MESHEFDLKADWEQLKRSTGVLLRYPKWIVCGTLVCAVLGVLAGMVQEPVYRVSTTVKLEDLRGKTPVLEALSIPTGTLHAEDAISILHSRSLVAEIVVGPEDGGLAVPEHPESTMRLGLHTLVDDETLVPLKARLRALTTRRSPDFRLFASIDASGTASPRQVRVAFLAADRFTISRIDGTQPQTFRYEDAQTIEYAGMQMRIATRGEWDDRPWRLTHLSHEGAISHVMAALRADTLPNHDGLVRVTVDDRNPHRCTEIARAIGLAYLERDLESLRERSAQAVELVGQELTARQEELRDLEHAIARIKVRNPDVLNPNQVALSLVQRESNLQTQQAQSSTLRIQLQAMAEQLTAKNFGYASTIGAGMDDPRLKKLLEYVATLENELGRVGRVTSDEYRKLLETKRLEAFGEHERLVEKAASIENVLQRLENGDWNALGLLESEQARDGQVHAGLVTRGFLNDFREVQTRLIQLRIEWTDDVKDVRDALELEAQLKALILGEVKQNLLALRSSMTASAGMMAYFQDLIEGHPRKEAAAIEAQLGVLWEQITSGILARVEGIRLEEAAIDLNLNLVRKRMRDLPESERALAGPKLEFESKQQTVAKLTKLKADAEVSLAGLMPTARVLDAPRFPGGYFKPILSFNGILGLIAGALLTIGLALLHERTRGRATSGLDLTHATGLPVLGSIPAFPRTHFMARKAKRDYRPLLDDPDGRVSESFRALRARLARFAQAGEPLQAIGITSAFPGEGRSQSALALATGFGLEGRRTLLIEADLRRPHIAHVLKLDEAPGLAECLDGRRHWRQATQAAESSNLEVLVAGQRYYSPGDQLGGPAMSELLADVRNHYDIVIVDMPQVNGLPDVQCLGPQLDGVVMIYSGGHGPSRVLLSTLVDTLRSNAVRVLGMVHNAAPKPSAEERKALKRAA
mgnify:FL=1|tara:strand:- start:20993 stop:23770 length:2778 start_codon:yes stop_codon:yes gene_type:complete